MAKDTSPDLVPTTLLRHRLVQADLLTAVVGLSTYATCGLPEVLEGEISEDPASVLRRVMACVEVSDLTGGAQYLWARAQALHEARERITWQRLLQHAPPESRSFAVWAQEHGTHVPYGALLAAKRLAEWSVARQTIDVAREALAVAVEAAQGAVAGVVGAG